MIGKKKTKSYWLSCEQIYTYIDKAFPTYVNDYVPIFLLSYNYNKSIKCSNIFFEDCSMNVYRLRT